MNERKIRKYWEKKILYETGFKVGYLFGYIYLYKKMPMDCVCFYKWVCDKNYSAPLLFESYEDAYAHVKEKKNYATSFQ